MGAGPGRKGLRRPPSEVPEGPRGFVRQSGRRPVRRDCPGVVALALTMCFASGCAPDPPERGSSVAYAVSSTPDATDWLGTAPDRFGFGSPASEARIARWDIDVKPDGEGLPAGSGSVAEGRRVYEVQCLQCHGPTGTEGPNDRIAATDEWGQWPTGRAVGSYWPYATTLFDYVRRAMPQATPGSLTDEEVYAVVAYVLHLNGLIPADAVMEATTLAAVEMPARNRFVPDDRVGGPEVR